MNEGKKVLGDERRELIIKWLSVNDSPLTGGELAKRTNVSRQVIVQDISILKARKHPIIATAQGYMLVKTNFTPKVSRIIACKHSPEETKEELFILVDHGVTVKQVMVEHAIYGEITASLMLSTRHDVEAFCHNVEKTKATLLSELTDGVHLHVIEADSNDQLNQAIQALDHKGFILND
ncbi:transcription repressor NadR [Halalkalibacter akibai]|uniref:Transcriptional repressor for NAD biosynthesis in gram-positives n=1 Tax=Halalkalibacter akibai (strain ATCC 43226 / DSM 21942 / CIP 109018 / JCM 9157 / 1139) TaxID=1236973 RepID=W4QUV9_HALA3|nr:transcription repressor NadR [Halalkalibacter akibai]GAE35114.1 transcriptional repressor for NAD biosynthesis in gram-positives [Halalkalibacter akibai JCM 9157]